MSDTLYLYVPENLDLPQELADVKDEAYYYIHTIITGSYCRKHSFIDGGTRIYSQLMRDILTKEKESKVRKSLLENRIIDRNEQWQAGNFSMSYWLLPQYRTGKIKRIACQNRRLVAKIKLSHSKRDDLRKLNGETKDVIKHLTKWLNKLQFDMEGAVKLVGQDSIHLMPTYEITSKSLSYSQDAYGRLHSPITRLLTELRQFLSINNQTLINIDISNSQLVFLSKLYQEYKHQRTLSELELEQTGNPITPGTTPLCSRNYIESVCSKGVTIEKMIEDGVFYDVLLEEAIKDEEIQTYVIERRTRQRQNELWKKEFNVWIKETDLYARDSEGWKRLKKQFRKILRVKDISVEVPQEITRKDFKVILFADVIFGNTFVNTPVTRLVKKLFPDFYEFILNEKTHNDIQPASDRFKALARNLQVQESTYMYQQVVRRLMIHHPEVPIIPIHDSLLTTPEHQALVTRVMQEEFERIGIKANLKVTK